MDGVENLYHGGSRSLQDRFDTRRLADRLDERIRPATRSTTDDRAFIEARDMFFLATADAEGRPQCSYKGGDPGFVRVLDEQHDRLPELRRERHVPLDRERAVNPHVGLLFIDFASDRQRAAAERRRLDRPETTRCSAAIPEAQFVVRVRGDARCSRTARATSTECKLVERSRFVPRAECETPVPGWKRREWARDVLPKDDPAYDPSREVIERG